MSDFSDMIKEAFVGEEPYDPTPGRAAVQAAIRKFEGRERILRYLTWFAVTFHSGVLFWAAYNFLSAEADASPKSLLLYATLGTWAMIGIGFMKGLLFFSQAGLALRKDFKRLELTMLDGR